MADIKNVRKLDATRKGFNYEFQMLLEGVKVPFRSANIICTPNGVEASINIPYHHSVYDLKPKTAVQIFYKEWWGVKPEWKLMFDGFFSRYDTNLTVDATRGVSITCRDFRMDIRKFPAALVLEPNNPGDALAVRTYFTKQGLFQQTTLPGISARGDVKLEPRTYTMGDQGLNPANHIIEMIAGFAAGQQVKEDPKNKGQLIYYQLGDSATKWSATGLEKQYEVDGIKTKRDAEDKAADGAFFLDAFARGLWLEAVGSVNAGSLLNKRIRVDKRLMVVPNMAGYTIFAYHNFGLMTGSLILGNSMFSSVEAIIMRVAGLFMAHVFSCNTPSLISLDDKSPAIRKVMHESVRNFLVNRDSAEFGAKYMLNETMLLPPLHFTAPPNCNIFLPPMYESIRYQYDHDVDITRGYYRISETLQTSGSSQLSMGTIQVPNALFSKDLKEQDPKNPKQTKAPQMTIEERYKGVNVLQGSVNQGLASADISQTLVETYFKIDKAKEIRERIKDVLSEIEGSDVGQFNTKVFKDELLKLNVPKTRVDEVIKAVDDAKKAAKLEKETVEKKGATVEGAMQKHAVLQFVNAKFSGRVANVDMAFNPFVMGGFPGLIVTDSDERSEACKPILGFVQQVKHFIVITSDGGEAATSVVMNNVRYIDEPTDMDRKGMPMFMKPTDQEKALLDKNLEYATPVVLNVNNASTNQGYCPPVGAPHDDFDDDVDSPYDVKESSESEYIYARDLITLSLDAIKARQLTRIYIDQDYAPNHITRYYRDVFGQRHHLMVGNTTFMGKPAEFMYDTIHEATINLMRSRPDLLTSYEACMEYVHRDICSADAFYQGILGLSVKKEIFLPTTKVNVIEYHNKTSDFDGTKLEDEYFGLTTLKFGDLYAAKDRRLSDFGGAIKEGGFSSIRETMPLTAFTKERKDQVKVYLENINRLGAAMFFADDRK